MVWRQSGEKPLSQPMITYFTASLGLNELTIYTSIEISYDLVIIYIYIYIYHIHFWFKPRNIVIDKLIFMRLYFNTDVDRFD